MQTLLLTSSGIRAVKEEIEKNLPKPIGENKLAHIITAVRKAETTDYYEREKELLTTTGFIVKELDLEGKNAEELLSILGEQDIIYVQGGNIFWLLKHVRESGFDKVLPTLLSKGIIYIGASAGSYICCPTIEMAFWKREQKELFGLTDFTALNFVPFLLTVHYKPELKERLQKAIRNTKYPVRILTDDQALLVKDSRVRLVGTGEEIELE